LNVPEQREGRDPGVLGDIKWHMKRTWTSTKWMLVTMVAPEVLLGKALADRKIAKLGLDELQRFAAEDGVPWTLTHSLFANMGGFVIRHSTDRTRGKPEQIDCGTQIDLETAELARQEDEDETTTGIKDRNIPGSMIHNLKHDVCSREILSGSNADPEITQIKGNTPKLPTHIQNLANPYHLVARDICGLRKSGVLVRLPYVTVEEINDKSKSDSFARAISVCQIAWTTVQIIARAIQHVAISQLEVAVVGFSVCAIVIYGLNWQKPKRVEVPYTLLQYRKVIPEQAWTVLVTRPRPFHFMFYGAGVFIGKVFGVKKLLLRVFGLNTNRRSGLPISNAAWNFTFPSRAEQIVWWATSLWCTCLFFIIGLLLLALQRVTDNDALVEFPLLVLYTLARLFLMVEIFRSLCFLPPDAYVATWASNIPHIA
jgi:hypothetical protein